MTVSDGKLPPAYVSLDGKKTPDSFALADSGGAQSSAGSEVSDYTFSFSLSTLLIIVVIAVFIFSVVNKLRKKDDE